MKIIVTGGCGFIGTNYILNKISQNRSTILNIDKLNYAGNKNNLSSISDDDNYSFVNEDICNIESITGLLDNFKPDALIHFAAETHVDRSIDGPMSFIHSNIVGTVSLLEACRKYFKNNINFRFLHISTDEVYGSLNKKGLFNENSPYNPSSPYSSSKASSDHLVRAWHKTYDLPILISNCSNNYGPYQFTEKLIPLIIANCIDEKPLPIYGEGLNIRDWLFVNDHCDAINKILDNEK
jgi:dTDP-D-glucose 4,6-dehydratase